MKKFLIIVIICFIIFNLFKIISYFYNTNKSEKSFNNLAKTINIENSTENIEINDKIKNQQIENINNLMEKNKNMFGWIYIEGTNINYPVMKSEDYLYKDFNGNYSLNGTPFIDKNCKLDDDHNIDIIHGHNMNNGTMFNNLLNYKDEKFFKENNIIKFYTKDTEKIYEVYAVMELNINNENDLKFYSKTDIKDEKDFENYLNKVDKKSTFKSNNQLKEKSNIIALSTCDNNNEENRVVLIGIEKS